jgi:hypothetical protein
VTIFVARTAVKWQFPARVAGTPIAEAQAWANVEIQESSGHQGMVPALGSFTHGLERIGEWI